MKRHAKFLQSKSRTHQVELVGDGWNVTSGSSGKTYWVREMADGTFWCGCKWHEYHPQGECSHVAAVRNWLAESEGRRMYLKGSVEDYRRSHQRYDAYNEGVIYTTAKVR